MNNDDEDEEAYEDDGDGADEDDDNDEDGGEVDIRHEDNDEQDKDRTFSKKTEISKVLIEMGICAWVVIKERFFKMWNWIRNFLDENSK